MKRIIRYFLLIILPGFIVVRSEAQVITSSDLRVRLKQYLEASPREELWLHVDRSRYIAGEDIWFSIFAINRQTGRVSGQSTIAYVELLNPWNIPVIQKRFRLEGGRGEGSFILPDSLSSGSYTIRAYTRWMKNYLPGNCFMQDVDVYNPFKNSYFQRRTSFSPFRRYSVNIGFYPEGGVLLDGVINRVAVRCFSNNDAGVEYSGIIRSNEGDSVTVFSTDAAGYGSFLITPEKGKNYSVTSEDGSFRLPSVLSEGFSLSIDNSLNDRIEVLIRSSGNKAPQTPATCFLVIHSSGNIDYLDEIKISEAFIRKTVFRSDLRGGVASIALIREDGEIMAERLFYSPAHDPPVVDLRADTLFDPRQKVSVSFYLGNKAGKRINDFSIAAVPAAISTHSIGIDDFLIVGTEYGPGPLKFLSGFSDGPESEAFDNLLIYSESNWIKWEDVISGNFGQPGYSFEQYGHNLSAGIRYREDKKSGNARILYMSVRGKIADFKYARRDNDGRFSFLLPADTLRRNLIIQPGYADNNMILELEPAFSGKLPESYSIRSVMTDSLVKLFSNLSFNYQASKIYGTTYRTGPVAGGAVARKTARFYGIPEMEVFLDDYISLPQMQEVFTELLPGIILRPVKTGYEIKITNPITGVYYIEPPLVMIDGLIINDLTILADLDPELVEKIEVVRTPYLVGDLVLNGIVNVITRSGNFSDVILPDYAVELPYRAVEKISLFDAPDYSAGDKLLRRIPDLRNTLYWSPSVRTGTNGEALVEFWTPDYPGIWMISINGITDEGELFSARKMIYSE
ncbi:MAG: hypothetical protein K0B05_02835 [Bacteroidales bacterium]|nr:hypothetical protein [Bacteroidales bacterium]